MKNNGKDIGRSLLFNFQFQILMDAAEQFQCSPQIFHNVLCKHVRLREMFGIRKTFVLQPEYVKVYFVTLYEFFVAEGFEALSLMSLMSVVCVVAIDNNPVGYQVAGDWSLAVSLRAGGSLAVFGCGCPKALSFIGLCAFIGFVFPIYDCHAAFFACHHIRHKNHVCLFCVLYPSWHKVEILLQAPPHQFFDTINKFDHRV